MVNEEKVKLMSKIAIYEKRQGKQEIPMNEFYKGDYVRIHTLKAVVSATIAFVVVVAMVMVYKMDYILSNVLKMDYRQIISEIVMVYGIWVVIYWLFARILYAVRYEKSRSNIIIYNHHLKKIQEESDKKVVKAKGGVGIGDEFIDY
ncbi:MAG: hypothetical protein Q4D51_04115 [Eubacteriales bacterium]|nr:hypothetical protein [Eubacteriales bacterium]